MNVAVATWFDISVNVQLAWTPDVAQAPPQPSKVDPKVESVFGVAVTVTTVPASYVPPAGFRKTLPLPVPSVVTVNVTCSGRTVITIVFCFEPHTAVTVAVPAVTPTPCVTGLPVSRRTAGLLDVNTQTTPCMATPPGPTGVAPMVVVSPTRGLVDVAVICTEVTSSCTEVTSSAGDVPVSPSLHPAVSTTTNATVVSLRLCKRG